MNRSHPIVRRAWRPGLWVLCAGICIGTGFWLYAQRYPMAWPSVPSEPTADTVFHVHTAAGRITIQLTDTNRQWDWDWTTPDCLQALVTWVAPGQVRSLHLQLTDPETHALELPIRSLYPEEHVSPGMAGAWCETRGREDQPDLMCSLAPLAGAHPAHVTVAVMGALAQARSYALADAAWPFPRGTAWSWSQWRPLVEPGAQDGTWQSACSPLTPQTRRWP